MKEVKLSLKNETMSDNELRLLITSNPKIPGVVIQPDQVSVVELESAEKQPPSYGIVLALTWDHPDRLPFQLAKPMENRPRRLAIRVDRQATVDFAIDILQNFAPQVLRLDPSKKSP